MRTKLVVIGTAVAVLLGIAGVAVMQPTSAASGGCHFATAPGATAALCDTFDAPSGVTGTRSGDLDGVLWGVSRATSANNVSQGINSAWASSTLNLCGTNVVVAPPNDVRICNGQVVESVNDNEGQTVLGMYPRQPFDFAGRTGTIGFDVSDNTQGAHASWPAFALTDQPVPAPYDILSGVADNARNSFGISFAEACQANGQCDPTANNVACVGVDLMYATSAYVRNDLPFTTDGCVKPSTQVGMNNRVEIQMSATNVRVYMSDAGSSTVKLVAHASVAMPLTRGLPWIEDVHYNAGKFNHQQTNTFSWDNFAFDGPVLARDLGSDILDNTTRAGTAANGLPVTNLGYAIPQGGRALTLQVPNVSGVSDAAAALLELTYWPQSRQALSYSLNGNPAHTVAWPFGNGPTFVSQTIAMPVPLAEVHDGTNTVRITTSDTGSGVSTANYDLILAGAGSSAPSTTTTAAPTSSTAAPTTSTTVLCGTAGP